MFKINSFNFASNPDGSNFELMQCKTNSLFSQVLISNHFPGSEGVDLEFWFLKKQVRLHIYEEKHAQCVL